MRILAVDAQPMIKPNHLVLISRTEYPSYAVLLMQDRDTRRVYRLYDFFKAQLIRPGVAYCVAGEVNSAARLYLVIESVLEFLRRALFSFDTGPIRRVKARYRSAAGLHARRGSPHRTAGDG
jgi:hypothetical protein